MKKNNLQIDGNANWHKSTAFKNYFQINLFEKLFENYITFVNSFDNISPKIAQCARNFKNVKLRLDFVEI